MSMVREEIPRKSADAGVVRFVAMYVAHTLDIIKGMGDMQCPLPPDFPPMECPRGDRRDGREHLCTNTASSGRIVWGAPVR